MKKLSKSALIITVVTALLFAVAVTALAVSWGDSGDFKNRGGSGKYGATMNLTEDKATASLSISDYFGIVEEGGGAVIRASAVGANGYFTSETPVNVENIYRASLSLNSSEFPVIWMSCDFLFYTYTVAQNDLYLNS